MSAGGDRTAEIWSTRLQRELLALTSTETLPEENGKEQESSGSILPPFVTVKDHALDIVKATCQVTFQIEIVNKVNNTQQQKEIEAKEKDSNDEENKSDEKTEDKVEDSVESTEAKTESENDSTSEKEESKETEKPVEEQEEEIEKKTHSSMYVLVTFDASMKHNSKGDILTSASTYPFEKPQATLKSGAEYFPSGSDVANGDEIEVSCDWTPSLHLSDAALNVSLTVRESILRGEPYYKVPRKLTREENTIDALLRKFTISSPRSSKPKRNANTSTKTKPRRDANKELQVGDVIELNEPPYNMCAGMYSCKAIRRPQFMESVIAQHEASSNKSLDHSTATDDDDENETPQGLGNYMKLQAGGIRKVAGSGIQGTKSMFKSFISTAKSAMEDSFLMITDSYIVELRSNKFNIGSATVTYAISVSMLAKLKFRRQESISLFFKQAPDDPLIFMCPDSADAVQQIQNVLKRHGVKGKHTNAATQRAIQSALNLVVEIQAKEKELDSDPTVENVDRIMSLYRQAAERFESAGDIRHEEVMNHMRKFLKKPRIMSILDGSYVGGQSNSSSSTSTPLGEILQAAPSQLRHEDDEEFDSTLKEHDADAMNASNERMDSFDVDDDLDNYLAQADTPGKQPSGTDIVNHDAVAELDAMFSAADKELADILNS